MENAQGDALLFWEGVITHLGAGGGGVYKGGSIAMCMKSSMCRLGVFVETTSVIENEAKNGFLSHCQHNFPKLDGSQESKPRKMKLCSSGAQRFWRQSREQHVQNQEITKLRGQFQRFPEFMGVHLIGSYFKKWKQ